MDNYFPFHLQRGKLTAAFGNVFVIAADVSSSEGKKTVIVIHFWNMKFSSKINKMILRIFVCLNFFY